MEEKKVYTPPRIESEEVLEQAALACNLSPFINTLYNLKDSSGTCGYNDS